MYLDNAITKLKQFVSEFPSGYLSGLYVEPVKANDRTADRKLTLNLQTLKTQTTVDDVKKQLQAFQLDNEISFQRLAVEPKPEASKGHFLISMYPTVPAGGW